MRALRSKSVAIAAIGIYAAAFAAQGANRLFINGNLASSGVIEVRGVANVPFRDVAKANNMVLTRSARGYEMAPAGGANMVVGLSGKVGDELFDGRHRFRVIEVIRTKKYTSRFSGDNQVVEPMGHSTDLVVLTCRIKNGVKESITIGMPGDALTALTDSDEHSFAPRSGLSMDAPNRGQPLLPGAAYDFALTFDVPEKAEIKDLVYEVAEFTAKTWKPFRVSLK